ncbi:MAG: hypothetical protein ACO3WI_11455, partial [Ilumatobacteraceae bacterium]
HDNRLDKIWWNEQWMGWPVDGSYAKSSNVDDAHKLGGKLLLIVGELDDKRVEVNSVEIFTVGHDGRIERVRAFFDQPTEFALADWFTPERSE